MCKFYTIDEWNAEGKRRFGERFEDWKFVCPCCGNVIDGRQYKRAEAEVKCWLETKRVNICTAYILHDGRLKPVFDFAEADAEVEVEV